MFNVERSFKPSLSPLALVVLAAWLGACAADSPPPTPPSQLPQISPPPLYSATVSVDITVSPPEILAGITEDSTAQLVRIFTSYLSPVPDEFAVMIESMHPTVPGGLKLIASTSSPASTAILQQKLSNLDLDKPLLAAYAGLFTAYKNEKTADFFFSSPTVTTSLPSPPSPPPSSPVWDLTVSGGCSGPLGSTGSLIYRLQGTTASGAPYYKAVTDTVLSYWLYCDPACGGSSGFAGRKTSTLTLALPLTLTLTLTLNLTLTLTLTLILTLTLTTND